MAKAKTQQVLTMPTRLPQYVSLRRVEISNPSMWTTKCATIPSLSISASAPLRYASFRCSSTSTNLPSSPKIFVKGLPLSTSEGRLMKVFSEFGEVTLVQLPIDKESSQSLGFAFISFAKEESAQLAVQEMNGKFFDGRFIYVTIAKPRSSKSSKRTTAYKF
ncbi:glycine-rich RNA-binding protein 4, mitochondrial isoform X2 [Cajanus cajan]|uniref:glycine-rich RNA-binding protein 4, mitochondrial isoform X2 n=1 Tax=Cajanus cajan TaxID=3821 RepID=UPI00098D7FC3|nr:glycine-rich RNA-binding protein 4, mitochondrial isoform X2 [Cajanus cajan]